MNGLHPWNTGDELACFVVYDNMERVVLYSPTEEEIRNLCETHELDAEMIMDAIRGKRPDIHTFVIDAPTHRDWLKKEGS